TSYSLKTHWLVRFNAASGAFLLLSLKMAVFFILLYSSLFFFILKR
ncbi:MAG: hypothetical protein ACI9LE_000507, partial [Paraglaciecola sp.]